MKKFLLAFAAVAAFAFVGCEKEAEISDELTGTVWESQSNEGVYTIAFGSNGSVTIAVNGMSFSGSYTCNYPDVTMTISNGAETSVFYGIFANGTLTVYDEDGDIFGSFSQTAGQLPDDGDEEEDADVSIIGNWYMGTRLMFSFYPDGIGKMTMGVDGEIILADMQWHLAGSELTVIPVLNGSPQNNIKMVYKDVKITATTLSVKVVSDGDVTPVTYTRGE